MGGPGFCEWGADPEAWPGLCSLILVRTKCTGCRQRSVRYYISSQLVDAEVWTSPAAIGASRTACTVPWTCGSRDGHPAADCLEQEGTLQRNFGLDVSIEQLRDRIGRQSWILASALP